MLVTRALSMLVLAVTVWLLPTPAGAHPMPFTYLDVRLDGTSAEIAVVAHLFDVAHDLGATDIGELMSADALAARAPAIAALMTGRLRVGGAAVALDRAELLAERQSIRLRGQLSVVAGALAIEAHFFPYDPAHQTFVNVYERNTLTLQAMLDGSKRELVYFPGSRQGAAAVMRRFMPDGARHVAVGSEHWLLLLGLVLLGLTRTQFLKFALAFLAADALTTSLLVLDLAHPAARLTDPALALAVVYVGADNLMVRGGRDVRPWIALAFGVLHGFWFGGGLALMDLPRAAMTWSLLAFQLGALMTALAGLGALAAGLALAHQRVPSLRVHLVTIGSAIVIAGGTALFVQRVFFPAGFL